MASTTPDRLARLADEAAEAIRTMNHATITDIVLPAPDLYPVLGNLAPLGHRLQQLCGQLSDALARSADHYDLTEDDGADPAVSIAAARDLLTVAAAFAGHLGRHLDRAQAAISRQGYQPTETN